MRGSYVCQVIIVAVRTRSCKVSRIGSMSVVVISLPGRKSACRPAEEACCRMPIVILFLSFFPPGPPSSNSKIQSSQLLFVKSSSSSLQRIFEKYPGPIFVDVKLMTCGGDPLAARNKSAPRGREREREARQAPPSPFTSLHFVDQEDESRDERENTIASVRDASN